MNILNSVDELLARVAGEFVACHHLLDKKSTPLGGLTEEDLEWMINNMPELIESIVSTVHNRKKNVETLARSKHFKITRNEDKTIWLIIVHDNGHLNPERQLKLPKKVSCMKDYFTKLLKKKESHLEELESY